MPLRQTNTLQDEKPQLQPRRLATIHELAPRPKGSQAVPTFAEVSAPRNWNRLGVSTVLHVAALVLLVRLAVWLPHGAAQLVNPQRESVVLIAPSLERPELVKPLPPPPPRLLAQLHQEPKLPEPTPQVTPKIQPPPVVKPQPVPEPPKVAENTPPPELPKPPIPEKKITQGLFDSGSSAKPTIKAPVREVQTGGFGDPNGVAGKSEQDRKLTVASVGAFELPTGPGNGNGSAGSHGKAGVVASAGFGDGVAGAGSGDRNSRGAVSTGGFGDATATPVASHRTVHSGDVSPVEILSKPRPAYTQEARQLGIEGEVLLDIMFTASGEIRVLKVVRGLGHGLDESAQRAAQQIRFNPAKRDGQPYDSDAVVHIVFALAE
ncbi:MAG: energy transducer TonB [Acidobacteria bacterium]|nr:energy transducer TonB [Acidobacteriota bacterium]MBV9146482.1 energy transducer TonB [Acidobacteriota bacterium]MBV9434628.1 energy transducer TonB [Acidobacteriota bacterium]